MKKLIFIFLLLPLMSFAQSQVDVMVGYKAVEVNYFLRTETLNYGIGISAVDSKLVQKRANNNDIYRQDHKFTQSYTPAVFGLVGGQFDNIQIVGKMGASYVKQKINDVADSKHLYFAVGIEIGYDFNDRFGVKGSFDNVNSLMGGLIIQL